MTGAVKFTFDQDFEEPSEGQAARLEREAAKHTDGDLEAATRQAFEEGRTAGRAEAQAGIDAAASKALESAASAFGSLSRAQQSAIEDLRHEAAELACLVARKLAPALIARWPLEEFEALIRECLTVLHEEPRIVIRVHETLIDDLRQRLDDLSRNTGFAGQIVLLPDDQLAPECCRVEWADGGAEWDPGQLAATIEAKVVRHVQAVAAAANFRDRGTADIRTASTEA